MTKEEIKKAVLAAASGNTQDGYREVYASHAALTPENYREFVSFPALFKAAAGDPALRQATTSSMAFGQAFSDYVTLSCQEFNDRYMVGDGPINEKTRKPFGPETKAYKEWEATVGKKVVSTSQMTQMGKMAAALKKRYGHEFDRDLCNLTFVSGGVMCSVDAIEIGDGYVRLVDVKTTSDAREFHKSVEEFWYDFQQALITSVFRDAVGSSLDGVEVRSEMAAVEKCDFTAPSRCAVFVLSDENMQECLLDVATWTDAYRECVKTGVWGDGLSETYTI